MRGLVLVHASGRAVSIPLGGGDEDTTFGRDALASLGLEDAQLSRRHFAISRASGELVLRDLGSRNGTFVDGGALMRESERALAAGDVVRAGACLLLTVGDVRAFERAPVKVVDGVVEGPTTQAVLTRATAIGRAATQLFLSGESGVGKEVAAAAFHRAARDGAPFIALNCATLPAGVADRLLFGVKRGAYTGAEADAEGHVHAARGGTLFLDEVGELEPAVQAKLLRFVETREFFPVGGARAVKADVHLCFATLKDLEEEATAGRFRRDLLHRIATPSLAIPPLSARKEEIPFFIELALRGAQVTASLAFVERALVMGWPGNVRQLLRVVEAALLLAELDERPSLTAADLTDVARPGPTDHARPASEDEPERPAPSDDDIARALAAANGNVSLASRELGISRAKLRRWMEKR